MYIYGFSRFTRISNLGRLDFTRFLFFQKPIFAYLLSNPGETAYIIENSQLLISGCGMPIHMAAALGKHVISLHGPTSVKRWAPRGNCTPFSVNLTCGPCLGKQVECLDNQCMKRILDEQVIDAIRQNLQI